MPGHRAPRLALEVGFLAALAVAAAFAHLHPYAIAGVMLLGWVLAAVFEWGALRTRSHYGGGRPPRWYVPQISLPPPRPLEQLSSGYPAESTAEEATWIASPAMLAEWPVAEEPPSPIEPRIEEETQVHDVLQVELAIAVAAEPAVADAVPVRAPEPEPEPEVAHEPAPIAAPGPPPAVVARTARHRVDPLADPPPKGRRFGRRPKDDALYAEVPDRPASPRVLPSRSRSED